MLHRSQDGNWSQETSGTQEHLHAVHDMPPRHFAVGDGGTFLVRTEDVWRSIESHTDADLRAVFRHVAVGREGAIIDCHPWPYTIKPSSRLACVPRRSPTTQDLLAFAPSRTAINAPPAVIVGAESVVLGWEHYQPARFALKQPGAPSSPSFYAAATSNSSLTSGTSLEMVIVGSEGTLAFHSKDKLVVTRLEGAPDLFGIAFLRLDAFIVGAQVAVYHLQFSDLKY